MMKNHRRNDVSIYLNGLKDELIFLLTDFNEQLACISYFSRLNQASKCRSFSFKKCDILIWRVFFKIGSEQNSRPHRIVQWGTQDPPNAHFFWEVQEVLIGPPEKIKWLVQLLHGLFEPHSDWTNLLLGNLLGKTSTDLPG